MLVDSWAHVLCHVSCDFMTTAGNGNEVINGWSRARWRERTTSIPGACPPPMTQDLPFLWTAASEVAPGSSHLFIINLPLLLCTLFWIGGKMFFWEAHC